jgi:hypothetical protein
MQDRTQRLEHKLRLALLAVSSDLGEVRKLAASQNILEADREFYLQMLDRAQHAVHSIQEQLDARPPRPNDH